MRSAPTNGFTILVVILFMTMGAFVYAGFFLAASVLATMMLFFRHDPTPPTGMVDAPPTGPSGRAQVSSADGYEAAPIPGPRDLS